jgi:hypothetical protein
MCDKYVRRVAIFIIILFYILNTKNISKLITQNTNQKLKIFQKHISKHTVLLLSSVTWVFSSFI